MYFDECLLPFHFNSLRLEQWLQITSVFIVRVGIKPGFYHKAQPGGFYRFYDGWFLGFYVGFINLKVTIKIIKHNSHNQLLPYSFSVQTVLF